MNVQTTRTGQKVVRVRDKRTGHSYTIGADSFDPNIHAEAEGPAVDHSGVPLPPKPRVTIDQAPDVSAGTATAPGKKTTTATTKEAGK